MTRYADIPSLIEPQLEGLETAYQEAHLGYQYLPSVMKWLVLIFIGSFASSLFLVGLRSLPVIGGRKEVS